MASTEEHLQRWRAANLIDDATAERVRTFEKVRTKSSDDESRPGALEASLYLGVIAATVGAAFLVGQNWEELDGWARIAALVLPGLLAILAGTALLATSEASLRRAGQVAWLAAVALLAGGVLVAAREVGGGTTVSDTESRNALMAAGLVAMALSVTLWVFSPSEAQTLAIAGSIVFLAQVTGNWPDEFDPTVAGIVLFALGGAGLTAVTLGRFEPRLAGQVYFGLLAAAGPYEAGLDGNVPWAEFLTFAVGAGLIALGVWRGHFGPTAAGVAVVFVALVTYVFEHFEDEIGAPVALMVSGGVVVAGVLLLVVLRGFLAQRRLR